MGHANYSLIKSATQLWFEVTPVTPDSFGATADVIESSDEEEVREDLRGCSQLNLPYSWNPKMSPAYIVQLHDRVVKHMEFFFGGCLKDPIAMEVVDPPSAEVQTSHTFPKDCFYHAFKYDFLHHGVFRVCLQDSVPEGVVEIPEEILEDCCSMCTVHSPKK